MSDWDGIIHSLEEYHALSRQVSKGLAIEIKYLNKKLKEARKQAFLEAAEMVDKRRADTYKNEPVIYHACVQIAKHLREKAEEE